VAVSDRSVLRRGLRVVAIAVRTRPRSFSLALVGATIYALGTVGASLVLGAVADRVLLPSLEAGRVSASALAGAAAAIVAVQVAKAAGIVARRAAASHMQFHVMATYRQRLVDAYLRLPTAWHRSHSTGELLSTVNSDVEAAFAFIAPLPFACGVLMLLAAAAGLLFAADPVLALVGTLLVPAVALANGRFNRQTSEPAMRAQERRGTLSGIAHESIDGALVVKTLGVEAAETQRFSAEADRLRDELVHVARLRAAYDALLEALPNLVTLLVVLVGAVRVAAGALTIGQLVQVAFLFTLLTLPTRIIGYLLEELPRAVVGFSRVEAVLAASEAPGARLRSGSRTPRPGTQPAAVAVESVTFCYGDDAVLRDVDLAVEPGTTVAVVGPTGSGKSTLAGLLLRLADPSAGRIAIDGHDLRELAAGALPGVAALVFQGAFLFDDTVRGNVTLGGPYDDDEVRAACRLAQADDFIQALPDGYDTRIGERGATLSGGQRQRVALARALVRRPRLLVLDDATSAVDPAVEARILAGLRDADLPSTVVVVAARQATIALADEVVLVEGGRVTARGTADELASSSPGYARLLEAYRTPAVVGRPPVAGSAAGGPGRRR